MKAALLLLLPVFALASSSTGTTAKTLPTFPLEMDKNFNSTTVPTAEPCEDQLPGCPLRVERNPRACNKPRIRRGCKLTCKICSLPSTQTPEATTTDVTPTRTTYYPSTTVVVDTTTTPTTTEPCTDLVPSCAMLATIGGCRNRSVWDNCKVSCGRCGRSSIATRRITEWDVGTHRTTTVVY